MTRLAWWLLGMLLLSNAVWFWHWQSSAYDPVPAPALGGPAASAPSPAPASVQLHGVLAPTTDEAMEPPPTEGSTQAAGVEPLQAPKDDEALRKAAHARATALFRDASQVEDPLRRAQALAALRQALEDGNRWAVEYALSTLHALRKTAFDRGPFVRIVTDHLSSAHGGIRRAALYALHAVDPDGADAMFAYRSAADSDPIVRQHTARLISLYAGPDLNEQGAAAVLRLLRDDDVQVRRGTLRGLKGATVPDEVVEELVRLSSEGTAVERQEVVVHALSGLAHKTRPVLDVLLAHLDHEDRRLRQRAHHGLAGRVPDDQRPYVARRYTEMLTKFSTPAMHREALKLIVRYGDGRLASALEAFAENEMLPPQTQALARQAAAYLAGNRPPR